MRLSSVPVDELDELMARVIMEQAYEILGDVKGLAVHYSGASVALTDGRFEVPIDKSASNLPREFRSAAERLRWRREWTF